ncbi:acyl-CoA dehydrogenase family protein [Sphingobacterium hungaricum]
MLNEQLEKTIKEYQHAAIKAKQLTPALLELIYEQQWFTIWVPKKLGGLEMGLKEGCELLEDLAYADGAFAWTVTLCSGATMFAGFIEPNIAQEIFPKRNVCFGGSGQVSGKAERLGEYYLVSGEWRYATGTPHLTHFTLNCYIYENGNPVLNEDGTQEFRSFFLDRDDVLIHYDWDTFGLECTASHSFSVHKILVSENRSFILDPKYKTIDNALFAYPFKPFAEVTLLVNYMGMFRRFMDLVQKYFFEKSKILSWATSNSKEFFKLHDEIEQEFTQQRNRIYELIEQSYNLLENGDAKNDDSLYQEIGLLSREIVKQIKLNVVALFPLCGIVAAQKESELNIVFRNLFTATQHSLLNIRD